MRAADARRAASTITSSSIRLSLAGGQVDCTMKTSRPRTFSISSILISPSLKRPTYARPSGICRLRAMSCDNAGVALPANSASVSLVLIRLCAARPLPPASTCELAGVEGFEPPNGGIKTRCLTTWRHPSTCAPACEQAGAHLTAASVPPPKLETLVQRRAVQAPRDVTSPAIRHPGRQPLRRHGTRARSEHAGAGPGEPRGRLAREPVQGVGDFRGLRPHHRLAVVPASRLKKGAYCDEGGISCQFRALEYPRRAHRDPRVHDDVPGLGQRDGGQPLAHPFSPGGETLNKNRYIGAQGQPQGRKLLYREAAVPEFIQHQKGGRD